MAIIGGVDAFEFSGFVEALYDAAQNPDAWLVVMAMLAQYLCADSALIRFYSPDWSEVAFSATYHFDCSFDKEYKEHFVHVDPIPVAARHLPTGTVVVLDDILPFERLKRTEFYSDYLRPQDKRHVLGGYIYNEGGAKALFGVQRGRHGKPFTQKEKSLLQRLSRHFTQTFRIHQILAETRALAGTLCGALDALQVAAFFLDRTGRVRFSNPSADALLRNGRLLTLRNGYLHAPNRAKSMVLRKLIATVTRHRSGCPPEAGGALQLVPPTLGSSPVTAVVTPWRQPTGDVSPLAPHIAGAVFVGVQGRPRVMMHYLTGAYGLTYAEARLAAKLVETCNLEEASQLLGITRHTARDYLKAIFGKTDCHSQAALIAMILSGPSGLWARKIPRGSNGDTLFQSRRRA